MEKNYSKGNNKDDIRYKIGSMFIKEEYLKDIENISAKEEKKEESITNNRKSEKKDKTTREKKKKKRHPVITFIAILFFAVITVILIFLVPYLKIAYNSYTSGFDTTRIDADRVPHIYDKDGKLIEIMYGYYDNGEDGFVPTYSSVYTNITSLPKYVGNAFTAIEDETFYDNRGVSLNRLLYAVFNYAVKGDSSFGGSTITQQLVKVATGDDSHSPSRKAREIGSALYLTDNWSKEKILASYMNLVYYGNSAYGIYEASLTYFDIDPKDLNIAQAAVLASLPNSPEELNPYKGDSNKTKLLNRQQLVLKKMLELGLITDKEYSEAKDFKIEFKNGSSKLAKNNPAISQYLTVAFNDITEIVTKEYSCKENEAIDKILDGNTKIYLNIDTALQNKVYELANSEYQEYEDFEIGSVLTTKNGEVIALVGSRNGSNYDHAYSMTRQTGSSIKPISVYSPAYDMGIIKPTSYVEDVPVSITNSTGTWNVTNANNKFRGKVTVNQAVASSLNTVAVQILEKVTIEKSYEYVKSFGITTVTKDDLYYPALALGGLSKGISPYEMTQAYNTISNDGVFDAISTVNKIEIDGKTLTKDKNEHKVISQSASSMMKESMKAVADYGTGKAANLENRTTYLKTGTTNNVKDVWTCGFTSDVTLCIWGGYDTPKKIPFYNVNTLWKKIMKAYYNE